ncbi:hypothetical protein [Tenuibacillus multivorans]|uniref:Uncharacterized protein n=1 Tax=Tenuibacillus multivorans TaxID=237069 RepID=A0A1G9X0J9_9BACI|nr:hypothetical protein [Tenuibacillus multivorans]GEL77288.1 hypothetical protein TMU01_15230 [Tenuibacillus multivorans]SDM89913.1 hypothetical protein SAMN05216498_0952 [Tenuibacillus multivorans]
MIWKKVTKHMMYEQLKWAAIYFLVITLIHIGLAILSTIYAFERDDFITFSHSSVTIFMLTLGILSAYSFMPRLIQNGVTRKDYFMGGSVSAVGLTVVLTFAALVMTFLDYSLVKPEAVHSLLGEFSGNWTAVTLYYSISSLIMYYIGWFISIGYYRYGWVIGFVFIGISFILIGLNDHIWEVEFLKGAAKWLPFNVDNPSIAFSLISSVILFIILLTSIRSITRRIRIKM